MNEKFFEDAISTHPGKVVASYNGATTTGVKDETQERFFQADGSDFVVKTIFFSYITSRLALNLKVCGTITIDGVVYRIKESNRDNQFVTTMLLVK
mgnify:CR=1 FL=1